MPEDGKYVFAPKLARRLVLSADYANNYLEDWNQKYYKQWVTGFLGNPWSRPWDCWGGDPSSRSKVGTLFIKSGSSVYTRNKYYDWAAACFTPTERSEYNWFHDKAAHKFGFEFFLDNDREETDPLALYDDDEAYWTATGGGTGTLGITVAEELTTVKKGASSLKATVGTTGTYAWVGVQHAYSPTVDWSAKEFICLYFYGQNSGGSFKVHIYAPDGANRRTQAITDNFVGWKRFVIPLLKMEAVGSPNLATVGTLLIELPAVAGDYFLDRVVLDTGQWVQIEVNVPEAFPSTDPIWMLYSWDGSAWQLAFYKRAEGSGCWLYALPKGLFFLDGTSCIDIWGGTLNWRGGAYYSGRRGETKTRDGYHGGDTPATMTYSSFYGIAKRIGFALKLPPDDGQDSSTFGISQCKLKLEILYDKFFSRSLWRDLWGVAVYEFEKSAQKYYGLDNINDSWLALLDEATKTVEFLVLSRRPLGLMVRADENQLIDQIELTLAKGTIIHAGQFHHDVLSRDADGDSVPDWLEELGVSIPNLVLKRDFRGW